MLLGLVSFLSSLNRQSGEVVSDEDSMAKHPPIGAPRAAVVEKEAWNKCAIGIVSSITMNLKSFLPGIGDLCSQGIEVRSCIL